MWIINISISILFVFPAMRSSAINSVTYGGATERVHPPGWAEAYSVQLPTQSYVMEGSFSQEIRGDVAKKCGSPPSDTDGNRNDEAVAEIVAGCRLAVRAVLSRRIGGSWPLGRPIGGSSLLSEHATLTKSRT